MLETNALLFVFFSMFIAGLVKGLVGLGLPAISLGLMLLVVDLKQAIVILLIPLFLTNIIQGVMGSYMPEIFKRFWILFGTGLISIWFVVDVMVATNTHILSIGLGCVLIGYASYSLVIPQIRVPERWESILSPFVGAATGAIGGLTGSMAVPVVLYMQALSMDTKALIQAMGIWFSLSSVALSLALGEHGILSADLGMVSAVAVVPAVAGMELGRRLRLRLDDTLFRKFFFGILLLLGVYILGTGYVRYSTP